MFHVKASRVESHVDVAGRPLTWQQELGLADVVSDPGLVHQVVPDHGRVALKLVGHVPPEVDPFVNTPVVVVVEVVKALAVKGRFPLVLLNSLAGLSRV